MKRRSESEVSKDCQNYLNRCADNIFIWRNNNMGVWRKNINAYTFNGLRGIPDFVGVIRHGVSGKGYEIGMFGKFLGIEIKAEGKLADQSDYQKEFQKNCELFGGIYIIVDSVEMLEEKLKSQGIIGELPRAKASQSPCC